MKIFLRNIALHQLCVRAFPYAAVSWAPQRFCSPDAWSIRGVAHHGENEETLIILHGKGRR
jgi:hypothetical protein